jgi:hypothetical protein
MAQGDPGRTQEKQIKILVIAETNFLFGYILEQSVDFDYLRASAEREFITIGIPEFCFHEIEVALTKRTQETEQSLQTTLRTLREIGRSAYAENLVDGLRPLLNELIDLIHVHYEEIPATLERITSVCQILPHTPEAHVRGRLRYLSGKPPFKETDCEIFAAILEFLKVHAQEYDLILFLNLDQEDFNHELIREELAEYRVEILFSTGECIAAIRRALGVDSPSSSVH